MYATSYSPPELTSSVVSRPDKITGADIQAICQEAGMQAVRKNRYVVLPKGSYLSHNLPAHA